MVEERPLHPPRAEACAAGNVPDVERVRHRLRGHHRAADQPGERVGVDGRRHRGQHQIVAQLVQLGEHSHQQIGVQLPLVHLIEGHRVHTAQLRIRQQTAQQNARGDELDPGAGVMLTAHREPDPVTNL